VDEAEYKAARLQLYRDYRAKLWDLERRRRGDGSIPTRPSEVIRLVWRSIRRMNRPFTAHELAVQINQIAPTAVVNRSTLASVLRRLHQRRELVVLEQGLGRRPSVFGMVAEEEEVEEAPF
jgi:hypothetical protein